jgi:hypothetical protein
MANNPFVKCMQMLNRFFDVFHTSTPFGIYYQLTFIVIVIVPHVYFVDLVVSSGHVHPYRGHLLPVEYAQ